MRTEPVNSIGHPCESLFSTTYIDQFPSPRGKISRRFA